MYRFSDLADKRILVTGASTGIGAAVAQALAGQGAHVALHFNAHVEAASRVRQDIEAAGGTAITLKGDLAETGTARRIVEECAAALGGLDVLINNAGSLISRTPILESGDALVDAIFGLNARAVLGTCQAAVPHMERRGGGAIINVGSIAGNDGGGPGSGVYASSKAFVHNLTRHLARELASKNIRVNAVSPGVVDTAFHAATPRERMETLKKSVALGRLGVPNDCVGAFLFLASSELSGYITGQNIHVNGGQLMP